MVCVCVSECEACGGLHSCTHTRTHLHAHKHELANTHQGAHSKAAFVCVCVRARVCAAACLCVYPSVSICACASLCVLALVRTCIRERVRVCAHACVLACAFPTLISARAPVRAHRWSPDRYDDTKTRPTCAVCACDANQRPGPNALARAVGGSCRNRGEDCRQPPCKGLQTVLAVRARRHSVHGDIGGGRLTVLLWTMPSPARGRSLVSSNEF